MKVLLALAILMTSTFTKGETFNRFWVGFKKDEITTQKFVKGLNQLFFAETINVSKNRGLVSYQPYVTKMNKFDLPDELALVVYESEDKYRTIRNTPEGQRYGDLHWDYFSKKSKSTVSRPFTGSLQGGEAYQLEKSFSGWQRGHTYVAIYKAKKVLGKLTQAFKRLKQNSRVNDSIILISDEYIYEYRSIKEKEGFTALPLEIVELKYLPSFALERFPTVSFGEGINFGF